MSWQIPTTRADGQPLTVGELAGYEIYYTTDNPNVSVKYSVSSGTATSYDISNLAAGTYYFAMAAIDTTGAKSTLSPVVAITLGP